jgi:CheY-like chemotaxis protein
VLLVEDGVVNQRVAVGLLRRGEHRVIVANNGREAVEAHGREAFDVILMDVQMPEMDGFEATALIRQREQQRGLHTPIVAMTAAAMKGDRERCLAAGMDAYVSKPISAPELFAVLSRFTPPASERQLAAAPSEGDGGPLAADPAKERIFDPDAAREQIAGGDDEVKEVAQLLVVECPKMLREIEDAIRVGDRDRLRRGAHTLHGSADVFGAQRVIEAIRPLEDMACSGDLSSAGQRLAELSREVDHLLRALRAWAKLGE